MWNLTAQTPTGSVLNTVVNQERDRGMQLPHQLLFQHLGHRALVCPRRMRRGPAAYAAAR